MRTENSIKRTSTVYLAWLDPIKAIALIGIFLNALSVQLWGQPYFGNPVPGWPPLAERILQLRPLQGYGVLDLVVNALRYLGWIGDHGTQILLLAIGFGLAWGVLIRQGKTPLRPKDFFAREAGRIFPIWIGAHVLFMGIFLFSGWGLSPFNLITYVSLFGLRITPESLYYFAPAWWFFSLIIQLYLVFPLLWWGVRRLGPARFLILGGGVGIVARAIGLLAFTGYLDAWSRGAIFVTQLPTFALGISLACWFYESPQTVRRWLHSPIAAISGVLIYLIGIALSFTLLGMAVSPFLIGWGLFLVLYNILRETRSSGIMASGFTRWISQHSLSLLLVYHPVILFLIPAGGVLSVGRVIVTSALAVLFTGLFAHWLESAVNSTLRRMERWFRQGKVAGLARRLAVTGLVVVLVLLTAEIAVRAVAPQAVEGWGERPSLEPQATFGWQLKPSSQTRLRWESYDYVVTANRLGFPGPEYAAAEGAQPLRIMTTGDGFTSAEGVDTNTAWPRLLEANLAKRLPTRKVEVMNFAIAGYGPNQYQAVIRTFAPVYKPNIIIIGLFVDDYEDVLESNESFQDHIGFDLRTSDSLGTIIQLEDLTNFARQAITDQLLETLEGKPNPRGYLLGNFAALERNQPDFDEARQLVFDRLSQIKATADSIGAKLIIAMFPAPVQVCGPNDLAYYPRFVDLDDSGRYDLDLPQRTTKDLAASLNIDYYDLLPALKASSAGCPFQPYNMHWLAVGHRITADYLTNALSFNPQVVAGGIQKRE